jgi:hypothetical protein
MEQNQFLALVDANVYADNPMLIAVADGAGSASHSDTGSRIAVETTLGFLEGWCGGGEEFTWCTALAAGEAARRTLFRDGPGGLRGRVYRRAAKRGASPRFAVGASTILQTAVLRASP